MTYQPTLDADAFVDALAAQADQAGISLLQALSESLVITMAHMALLIRAHTRSLPEDFLPALYEVLTECFTTTLKDETP